MSYGREKYVTDEVTMNRTLNLLAKVGLEHGFKLTVKFTGETETGFNLSWKDLTGRKLRRQAALWNLLSAAAFVNAVVGGIWLHASFSLFIILFVYATFKELQCTQSAEQQKVRFDAMWVAGQQAIKEKFDQTFVLDREP